MPGLAVSRRIREPRSLSLLCRPRDSPVDFGRDSGVVCRRGVCARRRQSRRDAFAATDGPDLVQGSPSASITIIEYASMTCSHCAAFHETTWPELKAKYIDTGRAKFILREFPLDPLATAGFMLARCAGPDKRNLLVDQLFSQQKSWAFVDKPIEPLLAVVKEIGMSQTDFETCLKNQDLYEQISQSRERAAEAFNIDSTPTFFVNGRKLSGELAISDFDRVIDPPSK
jgi:protein-disulfide isomerase